MTELECVKRPGELTPEEKWNEAKRYLMENILWYRQQQKNPKANWFFFVERENNAMDVLSYMMYLDGKDNEETKLLIALLGKPAAYTVPPHPGFDKHV
jgi:hypothetical protein